MRGFVATLQWTGAVAAVNHPPHIVLCYLLTVLWCIELHRITFISLTSLFRFWFFLFSVAVAHRHWIKMQYLAGLKCDAMFARSYGVLFRTIVRARRRWICQLFAEHLYAKCTAFRLGRCTTRQLFSAENHFQVSELRNYGIYFGLGRKFNKKIVFRLLKYGMKEFAASKSLGIETEISVLSYLSYVQERHMKDVFKDMLTVSLASSHRFDLVNLISLRKSIHRDGWAGQSQNYKCFVGHR